MNLTADIISLILSLISIVAVIWKLATETERIRSAIQTVRNDIEKEYLKFLNRHDVEIERLKSKQEQQDYLIHANHELIQHKSKRLEEDIRQVKLYLQKTTDFQLRKRIDRDDEGPLSGPL